MTSQLKTFLLLGLLTGVILCMGQALGGRSGLVVALAFALIMNLGSYWYSDKIVLRMYKARELSASESPMLHEIVGELAQAAGIPKPRIFLIPQDAPNAFATGRNPQNAAVAVTSGILRLLTPDELRGVLAHETAHIVHRDILIQCTAGVLASAIVTIAHIMQFTAIFGGGRSNEQGGSNAGVALLMAFLAPLAAGLIQFAISRSREYLADEGGARISGKPLALASALGKLDSYSRSMPMRGGNPSTAHLFIVNPFTASGMAALFSTHPPVAERIARLREMAAGVRRS
ncbi:MAG: zinc metalloprotease HtpX [Desulfovibrio sp.]|jgi:heat shock protein HtpX|nr:zinc metalloprotease HtpX [Desulfovibrio sp.]